MNIDTRMKLIRTISKMQKNKSYCKKLGIRDNSYLKEERNLRKR